MELYCDILDGYSDCRGDEIIKMDSDSLYLGLSACSFDDVVHLQLQHKFSQDRNNWLACDKCSAHTPGIVKPEFMGEHAIALCSKCDCMDGDTKYKHSVKGMSH